MKSFWGKWKREKKNERGNLTKTWSEEMPGWDPGIHRRFLKVEQALFLSDSLLGTYWTIWAALPRPKATSSGILFVCEEQEKFRLGPWAQTISIDVYNNNRGKGKKNKEKKKKKETSWDCKSKLHDSAKRCSSISLNLLCLPNSLQ